jgi:MFS family permease
MTAIAELDAKAGDRLARRNAIVLAFAQALGLSNNIIMVTTGSIVGAMLAPSPALATLPISVQVVGMWSGTLPMGLLAKRYGRRAAFQLGTMFGVMTGLLCASGVLWNSFALLLLGAFCTGFYAAAQQAYRFAAADTASDAFRPKAISWVLLGGIGGALFGPTLLMVTQDIWAPPLFVASYLGQSVLAIVAAGVLSLLDIPKPAPLAAGSSRGRPLGTIVRQPRFIAAVAAGVASYSIMNIIMTSAPLAMVMCGHTTRDATFGIQMHALAMFVPSFFTGSLIARFGVERIVSIGLALLAASAVADLSGIGLVHFWSGLILVGLGWNFAFIGATAMVTQCYRPEERNTVQAFNDFLIFGTMAIGSFLSGALLATHGWGWVNAAIFPVVAISAALLAWQVWQRTQPTAPA